MTPEKVTFENQTASFRDPLSGETMHSTIGAWAEAQLIYVEQSGLRGRLLQQRRDVASSSPTQAVTADPLVLFDIGLGIAANAVAALACAAEAQKRSQSARALHLFSFEKDLAPLRLALRDPKSFPFLTDEWKAATECLMENGYWKSDAPSESGSRWGDDSPRWVPHLHLRPRLQWTLLQGDFLTQNLAALPPPELVFYDFYSTKSYPELWGVHAFRKLWNAAERRTVRGLPVVLTTYSAATAVRAAATLAGWFVGYGARTPHKAETTVAANSWDELARPLDAVWVEHVKRSSKPLPADWIPRNGDVPQSSEKALLEERLQYAMQIFAIYRKEPM